MSAKWYRERCLLCGEHPFHHEADCLFTDQATWPTGIIRSDIQLMVENDYAALALRGIVSDGYGGWIDYNSRLARDVL